ncbi:hypothetical protein MMC25_005703 [Agyrium rufum]|nr:hypothetical protein [Agyrium rufum]
MSSHRLFRFPKPQWMSSPNTRVAGVYLAGALFSIGFFFFIDASTYSRSVNNASFVHIEFVDWIPGICSTLGMLVINSIEKTRLSADSYSYSGTNVAWKARLVLFLGFALMAGGLAGSVAVLVLKYVVPEPEYSLQIIYFGIANLIANGLIMLSLVKSSNRHICLSCLLKLRRPQNRVPSRGILLPTLDRSVAGALQEALGEDAPSARENSRSADTGSNTKPTGNWDKEGKAAPLKSLMNELAKDSTLSSAQKKTVKRALNYVKDASGNPSHIKSETGPALAQDKPTLSGAASKEQPPANGKDSKKNKRQPTVASGTADNSSGATKQTGSQNAEKKSAGRTRGRQAMVESLLARKQAKIVMARRRKEEEKSSFQFEMVKPAKSVPPIAKIMGDAKYPTNVTLNEAMDKHKNNKRPALAGAIKSIEASALALTPLKVDQPPVPTLSYGLDRVLFNPGVYQLQDPRSRVYNFDPYLETIMPVEEFDFGALAGFITSSKDKSLQNLAEEHKKRYVGSTSSMSGVLSHFHFLLSQWRQINTGMLSKDFPNKLSSFTVLTRSPTAIFLKWQNGVYAIDSDKEFASTNVLAMLGKSMEKLFTLPKGEYEKYRKSAIDEVSDETKNAQDSFHYTTMGDILMRSQLDAYDARLPGTGMFDLKTRAVVSVRMDAANHELGSGYEIKGRLGEWESFEREYFDMIRSAMLKYSLQVRMGRMDGIFVAFHNTDRIFGFQYVSLDEIDHALHGTNSTALGDQEFKISLDLLNKILNKATERFPKQSIRIHLETRDAQAHFMYVFAEPISEDDMIAIQSRNEAKMAEVEKSLRKDAEKAKPDEGKEVQWSDIQADVQDAMDQDELGDLEFSEPHIPPVSVVESVAQESVPEERMLEEAKADEARSEEAMPEEVSTVISSPPDSSKGENVDIDSELELAVSSPPVVVSALLNDPLIETVDAGGKSAEEQAKSTSSTITSDNSSVSDESVLSSADTNDTEITEDDQPDADKVFLDEVDQELTQSESSTHSPILGMTLTIRNKVNGKYCLRPEGSFSSSDTWAVEYSLDEIVSQERARSLYEACQGRRKKALDFEEKDRGDAPDYYIRQMRELSAMGKEWRGNQAEKEKGKQVVWYDTSSGSDSRVKEGQEK